MSFTIRLEQADGTPAESPTLKSAVPNWRRGDTIPLGRGKRSAWSRLEITTPISVRCSWLKSGLRTSESPSCDGRTGPVAFKRHGYAFSSSVKSVSG